MGFFKLRNPASIEADEALPGREQPMRIAERHVLLGTPLKGPFPPTVEQTLFGMGCFWGAERIFWEAPGVYTTAVGYAGGFTPNPTYEEVCSGMTGHAEVVMVAYDTALTDFGEMTRLFWENHDPTQVMRQGNDVGSQYRSIVLCQSEDQLAIVESSRGLYQRELSSQGHGAITTEIVGPQRPQPFYYAEDYHQQYLAKTPGGYCGLGGTGVACPVSLA